MKGLEQSLTQRRSMIQKDRNTSGHQVWTVGNEDPMHEMCIPHVQVSRGNSKGEIRERSRHQSNKKRGLEIWHKGNSIQDLPNYS